MLDQAAPISLFIQTRSKYVDYQWLVDDPPNDLTLPPHFLNRIAPSEPGFVFQKKQDGTWSLHLYGIPTTRRDRAQTRIRIEAVLHGSGGERNESFPLTNFISWLLQDWLEMLDAEGRLKQEAHVTSVVDQVFDEETVERLVRSKPEQEDASEAERIEESEALCSRAAEELLHRWKRAENSIVDTSADVSNEGPAYPSHAIIGWGARNASTDLGRALKTVDTAKLNVLVAMFNLVGEDEADGLWEELKLDDVDRAFILRSGNVYREELKKSPE